MCDRVIGSSARLCAQVHEEISRSDRPFDALLLDISMVRKHGDEVCQELRSQGIDIPVVAMTGTSTAADMQRFLGLGFDFMLPKPFDQDAMEKVLLQCKMLGKHGK